MHILTNYSSIKFRGSKQNGATKTCHHQHSRKEGRYGARKKSERDSTRPARSEWRNMVGKCAGWLAGIICRERSRELSWESIEQIFSDYISDFFHASVCVCQTQIQIRFY